MLFLASGIMFCYLSQQAYTLLENYTESVRGITFNKGDVVEVLDTEKTEEWLVRKQNNKEEVTRL